MLHLISLAKFFFNMCLLRKNPQDLPNSLFLLQLLALSNFLINVVINISAMPIGAAILLAISTLALVYGLTTVLLNVLNFKARLRQTLIAIFGTELVFAGPAILLRFQFDAMEASGQQSDPIVLLSLVVIIWNLAVTAHIIRHALDRPFGAGCAVSIMYNVIIYNVLYQVNNWLVGPA